MPKKKKNNLKSTSSLNFRTRKTQFIAAILIVAIMGAGWFTYKSFADTRVHTCKPTNCLNGRTLGINAKQIDNPAKDNTKVYRLSNNGQAYITLKPVEFTKRYNVCAEISGQGKYDFSVDIKGGGQIQNLDKTATSSVSTHCIKIAILNGSYSWAGNSFRDLNAYVTKKGSGTINVASIYINLVGSSPNNAPTSPSK